MFFQDGFTQSIELGTVNWLRDYDEAIAKAQQEDKTIFILFQEVPGCATCRNYGQNVLSEPLIVDAIDNYFIPLAIFNNNGGADAKILRQYNEPSWNNPVVRIVDKNGKPIAKRLAGNYNAAGLVDYMATVFPKSGRAIPDYLAYLNNACSANSNRSKTVDFSMYCFWSGEGHLGKAEGVVSTEPGFKSGKEIVRVNFDPAVTNVKKLKRHAEKANCRLMDDGGKFRADKDPQYYLKQSQFKYLPLTPNQRTVINTMLVNKGNPLSVLSPSQETYLGLVENGAIKKEVLYDQDFKEAWEKLKDQLAK